MKPHGAMTWDKLAKMSPAELRDKGLFPRGFLPLPHPNHAEGGMLFPRFHIDEELKQTKRDLTRFDLDFDLPDPFLPEFPPAIFLTTRPDLGDVSQGQLVTHQNFYSLFKGILNPKHLSGRSSASPRCLSLLRAAPSAAASSLRGGPNPERLGDSWAFRPGRIHEVRRGLVAQCER